MNNSQVSGGQTTVCDKCEAPQVLYPPIPKFNIMLLQPCDKGDSIEKTFECKSCGEMNKRYWDAKHGSVVTSKHKEIKDR